MPRSKNKSRSKCSNKRRKSAKDQQEPNKTIKKKKKKCEEIFVWDDTFCDEICLAGASTEEVSTPEQGGFFSYSFGPDNLDPYDIPSPPILTRQLCSTGDYLLNPYVSKDLKKPHIESTKLKFTFGEEGKSSKISSSLLSKPSQLPSLPPALPPSIQSPRKTPSAFQSYSNLPQSTAPVRYLPSSIHEEILGPQLVTDIELDQNFPRKVDKPVSATSQELHYAMLILAQAILGCDYGNSKDFLSVFNRYFEGIEISLELSHRMTVEFFANGKQIVPMLENSVWFSKYSLQSFFEVLVNNVQSMNN